MAFRFKLELEDGTPADPPALHTAVPNWQAQATRSRWARTGCFASSTSGPRYEHDNPCLVVEPASG
jgi:hypothetical protein